jgi:GNAT superfamily N-acetyltransferase
MEKTMEDAARLAECFNSFDDSDSWPGGFTGGNPYTAQRVYDDLKKSTDLRTIVAQTDDKIVGHCNVVNSALDTEAVYIGLLGVNPVYQGKGYGKLMLIEASETAAQMGKRRIDLHTWGGNLKAMPLYKRVGYNWVPKTRVLMESHIPGIIGCPMFSDFFQRHNWYDSFKVEIKQEMDDIVEGEIGVFKYHFEGNNGDVLDVTIDREAKGICGFSLTMDGKVLSATIQPITHTGYIGIGECPVKIAVHNGSDEDASFTLQVRPAKSFTVNLLSPSSGTIEAGQDVSLDAVYRVEMGAQSLDREITADDKITTQAEWTLTIDEKSIDMYSGLIPTEAVTLSTGPDYPTLAPGETNDIGLGIRNNTKDDITGEVILSPSIGRTLSIQSIRFKLKPGEISETPLTVRANKDDCGSLIPIDAAVYLDQDNAKRLAKRTSLQIPVIGATSAVVYKSVNDFYVLENENIRILINGIIPHLVRKVQNKNLEFPHDGWSLLPEMGMPFPRGGSEWERKKFEMTLNTTAEYAEIILRGESEERPGLFLTNTYRVYAGREDLEISTKLENTSAQKYENLGLKIGGWMPFMGHTLYVPIDNQIYRLDDVNWFGGRQIPKEPKRYTEGWAASELPYGNGVFGFIWSEQSATDIRIMRQWSIPRIEYKIPDLEPGSVSETTLLRFMISQGNWKKIRNHWAKLSGKTLPLHTPLKIRSDLEIGFTQRKASDDASLYPVILVDRNNPSDIELRARIITDEPISCKVRLQLPGGLSIDGNREIEFDVEKLSHTEPLVRHFKITVEKAESWFVSGGELLFKFDNRIERRPLSVLVFDTGVESKRTTETVQERALHSLISGPYRMGTSPDFLGNMVFFGKDGEESLFRDTFPEPQPFIWDDKHYSGIRPRLIGSNVWDWQSALPLEKWTIKDHDVGPWMGYLLESTFQHATGLKGIHFTVHYMLLRGTPLAYIRVDAENKSGSWKELRIGFNGVPIHGGVPQSHLHAVVNKRRILYEPPESDMNFSIDPLEGWAAYEEPQSGQILGIISTVKQHHSLNFQNSGSKGQWFTVWDRRRISIGQKTSISAYVMMANEADDVEKLKMLPENLE